MPPTTMNREFDIPPLNKSSLTSPSELVKRLQPLVGKKYKLTKKPRTDGSSIRKMIASTLEKEPLPPPAPKYHIATDKGLPKILREYLDTYVVTTGDTYNLQVWNRNPSGKYIQIDLVSGGRLTPSDVRFVFVKVDKDRIESIVVLTPDYIVKHFGAFGKHTVKQQLIISATARAKVLATTSSLLFAKDTTTVLPLATKTYKSPTRAMNDKSVSGEILSLELIRPIIADKIVGTTLAANATKNRGQDLEEKVAKALGYNVHGISLVGGYPDIPNQALEVKVQDAPTVDLGRYSPEFPESVANCPGFTTADIRYLIALTDETTGKVLGAVLCPGEELGQHFSYVADENYKCQRAIPMSFFQTHAGKAVFNP